MNRRIETFDFAVRSTLEYAEATKLIYERNQVQRQLALLDDEIKSVRRLSPSAVEMARKDISAQPEQTAKSPERILSDSAPGQNMAQTLDARLTPPG